MKSKTNLWKWAREMKRLYGDGFVMECFFSDHYLFVLNGSEFVDPVLARVITATDTIQSNENILLVSIEKPPQQGYGMVLLPRSKACRLKVNVDKDTFTEKRVLA